MSEKITYRDSKGNLYEQADCDPYGACEHCDLDNDLASCLCAPCGVSTNWKLVGQKIPEIAETLRAAIVACQYVRDHACDFEFFKCPYWVKKTCPSRKHLAALGDENAWRAK